MTFRVFGYGSLVNRRTLPPHTAIEHATVRGWRRAWRATSRGASGGVCSLSVVPDRADAIDGVIVTFEDDVWPLIRRREHNYDPLRLEEAPDVIIFRANAEADRFGDGHHPIHLSYIDVAIQGFLEEFGHDGVRRFMDTTDGWHVPIVDDRLAPGYPRAQLLSAEEIQCVDEMLESVDAIPLRPQESRSA